MLIINKNLINLVGGSGDCNCYMHGLKSIDYVAKDLIDSEKCYQHCCARLCSDSYEYTRACPNH